MDLDTYEPLDSAIDDLEGADVGPDHAGLRGCRRTAWVGQVDAAHANPRPQPEIGLFSYYAYVPGPRSTRTNFEGHGFLHDIVFLLEETGAGHRGHLVERSDIELRQAFAELVGNAALAYRESGVRTLVVVDGLDHVQQDDPASDSLLAELPRPEEIPDGVVFIVGSRTTSPLKPEASTLSGKVGFSTCQITDWDTDPVIDICRRAAVTRDLGSDVHDLVAELEATPSVARVRTQQARRCPGPDDALAALHDIPRV